MKEVTILVGCYYPSFLDSKVKSLYIKKDVSMSNLLYERVLFEDFVKADIANNDVVIVSSPSFGYYKKQCKKSYVKFDNLKSIRFANYSTRRFFCHISKAKSIFREINTISRQYKKINIVISEAHLPYLLAVQRVKKKCPDKIGQITLIVPDLPKNIRRSKYNFIEYFLKKHYVHKSNKLMKSLPTKYVCFTKDIANEISNAKPKMISYGVISNSFEKLIDCEFEKEAFIYSGKIDNHNGIHLLIDAFKEVSKNRKNAKLIICGDGPLSEYVAHESKTNNNIEYLGQLNEAENNKILKKACVLLNTRIPSEMEKFCFPSKLVNYAKYNCQIIVFENQIYRNTLKGSIIYCPTISVHDLARTMIEALSNKFNIEDRMNFLLSCKSQKIIDFCNSVIYEK